MSENNHKMKQEENIRASRRNMIEERLKSLIFMITQWQKDFITTLAIEVIQEIKDLLFSILEDIKECK